MERQAHRFAWRGITIEATYTHRQWGSVAHLELRSVAPDRAPLPVTETGYRSHFHPAGTIEAHGGDVVAQVIAWLDAEPNFPASSFATIDTDFNDDWRRQRACMLSSAMAPDIQQ
jgi:hypothetical protein